MDANPINDLAAAIAEHFERPDLADALADTIYAVNPRQTLGAGALAETLWDTFTHNGELPVTETESASEGCAPVRTYPNGDQKYGPYANA